jgi:hypothetical protein
MRWGLRGGKVALNPMGNYIYNLAIIGLFGIGFACFIVIRARKLRALAVRRGWDVGHRGRDLMFYEERVNGQWERIRLDGEMLSGHPHHVIYFADPDQWQKYPDWARGRRDEIIARIKSQFREPDYRYD